MPLPRIWEIIFTGIWEKAVNLISGFGFFFPVFSLHYTKITFHWRRWTESDCSSFKALFPDNWHHLTCLAVPWKTPLAGFFFIWPQNSPIEYCLSLLPTTSTPTPGNLSKIISINCFNISAAWGDNTNRKVIKIFQRKNWEIRCPEGLWKVPTYLWESRRLHIDRAVHRLTKDLINSHLWLTLSNT